MQVVMLSAETKRSAGAGVVICLYVVLLYVEIWGNACCRLSVLLIVLLGILRLLIITAFGENLRQWDAKVSASPPLSSTHYGLQRPCSAKVKMWSAAVEKPPYGRHFHLAGVNMLLDVGAAATEEQG